MPIDVSIIIVSWNTKACLARCLATIPQAAGRLGIEVIVVDNESSDGSQAMVAADFPQVRLIQNQDNVGFGRANNIGARASSGRNLLILGSDCELEPGALQTMAGELDRDASIGMVMCTLLNPDGSLQPSVQKSFPSPLSLVGELFFFSALRYAVYRRPALHRWLLRPTIQAHRKPHDVAWGGGACLLVRREAYESVGGFDEGFFMYCEDMDLCKRVRDAGYRLRYVPTARVVHLWGKSTSQRPGAMLCESMRSRVYYFGKHFPGWGGAVSRWLTVTELRLRQVLFSLAGVVPSPRRQFFHDQAKIAAECVHALARSAPPSPASGSDQDDGLRLFLAVLISFSLFRYLHDLVKFAIESPFIDFAHYYTFATVVALKLNPFDPQAVAYVDHLLNIRRAGGGADYPPLFYLFMQPWLELPFRPAAMAWLVLKQVCLVGAFVLCLVGVPSASFLRIGFALFVFLNFQPVAETLALGQSNSLLLFLVTAAWWGLRQGHTWLTAVATAVAMHIKIQYGLLIPLLWCMGARRESVRAFCLSGTGFAVGMIAWGVSRYADYADLLVWSPPAYLADWVFNLSLRATLYRLFVDEDTGWFFADGLWLVLDAVLFAVIVWAVRHAVSSGAHAIDWAWGLGLAAVLILSPMTEEHHMVILLLPLTLLLLQAPAEEMQQGDWILLGGSILLLASRYSLERFPVFHHGALSLLMAGKLLGVGCLTWALLRRLRTSGGAVR